MINPGIKSWKSYERLSELHPQRFVGRVLAYVKLGLPPPLLRTYRCKVLSCNNGGVEESFRGVIEDQVHFVLTWDEGVEDGRVREQPDGWSDNKLLCGNERWQGDDRSEMRR